MIGRWRRQRSTLHLDRPWREIEYAVVDLETTGLDLRHDAIVSYGAALIVDGRIPVAHNTYGLVRPQSRLSHESIVIHTLRPSDVDGAPPLSNAVEVLEQILAERVLIAHAAWIEKAFLKRAFAQHGKTLQCNVIDTAAMARAADLAPARGRREPDLESLASVLGLPVVSPHHALGDAITTGYVFLALAAKLAGRGYVTTRDFVDLTAADRTLRR